MIDEKGSPRPRLTAAQKATKPPVVHPMAVRHPYTGRTCLYCDPGYTIHVLGLAEAESAALLRQLFAFQTRDEFIYRHKWQVGDVLIWDNIATIHIWQPAAIPTPSIASCTAPKCSATRSLRTANGPPNGSRAPVPRDTDSAISIPTTSPRAR